jgi:hypothetical protein
MVYMDFLGGKNSANGMPAMAYGPRGVHCPKSNHFRRMLGGSREGTTGQEEKFS